MAAIPLGKRVEGVSRVVDVSWKVDSSTGDDVTKEGKHRNTSVLDLDVTKTFEASFIGSVQKTEGVEEAKWWLDTKFILEGVQGGGLGSLLDRGECTGGGDKGGKDGGLHVVCFLKL